MDNIYLIYGDEEFLIEKEIKNIINKLIRIKKKY